MYSYIVLYLRGKHPRLAVEEVGGKGGSLRDNNNPVRKTVPGYLSSEQVQRQSSATGHRPAGDPLTSAVWC